VPDPRSDPVGMPPTLANALRSGLVAGDPDVAGPLAVFPLFGPPPRLRFRAFGQVAGKGVAVRERAGGAAVSDLTVVNQSAHHVLLLEGEEVLGARQDRTFDISVLVAAGTSLDVPVSCVERGRWDPQGDGQAFAASPQVAYPELRRAKSRQVREGVARGLEARAFQGEVWASVERKHLRHGVARATGAMRDVFERRRAELDDLCAAIAHRPGQVGMLAALGGRLAVLDHASDPDAFAALHGPLVRGYALDALEVRERPAPSTADAALWVDRVCTAPVRERDGIGLGREARFAAAGLAGTGLICGDELVQLTAFAEDDAHGRGAIRIRRPSRRR
jgi:hypothetical protein